MVGKWETKRKYKYLLNQIAVQIKYIFIKIADLDVKQLIFVI